MKRCLVFLFLMGLIVSCAKTEKTETRFMLNTEAIYQEMNMSATQKVLLLGKSSNGYFFSQKLDSSNAPSKLMEIPNGSWIFYAFAWDEVSIDEDDPQIKSAGAFGGDVICGKSSSINLNGQSIDVDLNLSLNGCKAFGAFTVNANSDFERFNKVVIDSCTPIGVTALINEPNFEAKITESDCLNESQVQRAGYTGSYRFQIKSQNNFEGVLSTDENSVLSSECIPRGTEFDEIVTQQIALNLPFGVNQAGLGINYTVKQYFNSADCGTTKFNNGDFSTGSNSDLPLIYHEELFSSTLSSNDSRVLRFGTSEPSISKLAIKSSFDLVCANNSSYYLLSGWTKIYYPQSGIGTPNFPFVMCTQKGVNGSTWYDKAYFTNNSTVYPVSLNSNDEVYCPYDLSNPGTIGTPRDESANKKICLKTF